MTSFAHPRPPRSTRRPLAATLLFTALAAGSAPAVAGSFELVASPTPSQALQLHAPLVRGPDGLVYGNGWYGGAYGQGSIFRVEADGSITLLHSFGSGTADGRQSPTGMVLGSDGWLYGTTDHGGPDDLGTIYRISAAGEYQVLHTFVAADGSFGHPSGRMVQGGDGTFYGTLGVGAGTLGAVFKMTPDFEVKLMHRFRDHGDGSGPSALAIGRNGVLYGTTEYTHGAYGGTFFSIAGGGKFKVLHTFDCAVDGCQPYGSLVVAPDGAIFGAAPVGGPNGGFNGTVYRFRHGEFGVIHAFSSGDPLGWLPQGGLAIDSHGELYGTTEEGGHAGAGVVFSMHRTGEGKAMHAFSYGHAADGVAPVSSPTVFPDGYLYGGTLEGGIGDAGVVFRLALTGH